MTEQMKAAVRKAMCLSDLVRTLQTENPDAIDRWAERWSLEERVQAQVDLEALLKLERLLQKKLIRD